MDFSTWWKSVEPMMQFGLATVLCLIFSWAIITTWFRQTRLLETFSKNYAAQTEIQRQSEQAHVDLLRKLDEHPRCPYPDGPPVTNPIA